MSLGATDPAAQGLDGLLGAKDEDARSTTWSAIQSALLVHDGDVADFDPADRAPEHPLLHVADQIVIIDHDKPAEIAQAFIDGVRHWFSADLRRVGVDEAQDVLDTWVDQNTAGLIKSSALQADQIELAMQNVVLFAAQWKKLFDETPSPRRTSPARTGRSSAFRRCITIANVVNEIQRPTLVLAHNKTLAAQPEYLLFQEK